MVYIKVAFLFAYLSCNPALPCLAIPLHQSSCISMCITYCWWLSKVLNFVVHQNWRFTSCSIGAEKVKRECTQFQEYCKAGNLEGYIFVSYILPMSLCHFMFIQLFLRSTFKSSSCMLFQMQKDIPASQTRACNSQEETRELFSG